MMHSDRQVDMTRVTGTSCDFANSPKYLRKVAKPGCWAANSGVTLLLRKMGKSLMKCNVSIRRDVLCACAESRKAQRASSCPSVRPFVFFPSVHTSAQLPADGFTWNLALWTDICENLSRKSMSVWNQVKISDALHEDHSRFYCCRLQIHHQSIFMQHSVHWLRVRSQPVYCAVL